MRGSRTIDSPKVAEFFAGIGLVRSALERAGMEVIWANDIEPVKFAIYEANFGGSDFVLGDVRDVKGDSIPIVDLATASFPCTDLSLAGSRRGFEGDQSSMFWEFVRVIKEMAEADKQPRVVLLENVPGFATSHGGADFFNAIQRLNDLGYSCDTFVLDAIRFVPQSRQRLFILGTLDSASHFHHSTPVISDLRPDWLVRFVQSHPKLKMSFNLTEAPPKLSVKLEEAVERLRTTDSRWWDESRVERFVASLVPLHRERLETMIRGRSLSWRTAYRRTRKGVALWEIRSDPVAGCLRTARGGSSKQAVVEAGRGKLQVRWMTPAEYAALQGAPELDLSSVSVNKAIFGLGDAVCVPVVEWIANVMVTPLLGAREKIKVS